MTEQQLGKYTVIRRLGAGGMAEVNLCRLNGIGGFEKQVVVKRIRADIANDSEFVTMFFDEARLAANLNHPNLIQLFEVDELDGVPYIAMEYVKGPTLAGLLQRVRKQGASIEYGHLALIFAGACAGLDHAHNAEDAGGKPLTIVHRDISPQNIIVSLDGTPKIFDFGVAKARGSLALTATDRIKGKFAYMAPEQLRALPVDAGADIYALGVCLYEAAVGRRPFVGATEPELFAARLDGRFRRPAEVVEDFPTELEHIILAAMWPDPEGRPTAAELRDRLLQFASSGSFASSSKELAAWMRGLCPDDTTDAYESYASSPSLTPVPRSGNNPGANAVDAADGRRFRRVGLAAVMLLAAAAASVIVARSSNDEPPAHDGQRPTQRPYAALPAPPTTDQTVKALLDKAAREIEGQRLERAEELLAEARVLRPAEPALSIREQELSDRVYGAQVLLEAQHAVDANQYDRAIQLAEDVISRGDNAAASRILRAARDATDGERSGTKPLAAPQKRARPTGSLTITTQPSAKVFVDGDYVGQGTIRRRVASAGSHVVEVRIGDRRLRKTVSVTPGGVAPIELGAASAEATPVARIDATTRDSGPKPELPPTPSASPSPLAPTIPPPTASPTGPGSPARVTTPAPVVTAPPRLVGSLDASPTVRVESVDGGVTASEIESALERVSTGFRDCYRVAAKARQETPPVTLRFAFEIDQQRAARDVRVGGDAMGMAACIKTAASNIRIRTIPDIGAVSVTAILKFRPTK